MTDTQTRRMTAAAVLLVGAIAAVVSFLHIQHLAATHGQPALAAALLPLSIDGTVAATSLAMLRAARAGLGTPWLARFGLVLAVGATLAANVGYGLPYGAAGALISGWPAAAFLICAELAVGMVRRIRPGTLPSATPALRATAPQETPAATVPAAPSEPLAAPPVRVKPPRHDATTPAARRAKAERLLRANPAMPRADVVKQSGVSERTADRIRSELPRSDRMTVVR